MAEKIYYHGTGRRKNAIARVRLTSGKGKITVNGKDLDEYQVSYLKLLVVVDSFENFDTKKLITYLSSKLESYKIPRKIECVENIKKTFNGKIDRKSYRNSNK